MQITHAIAAVVAFVLLLGAIVLLRSRRRKGRRAADRRWREDSDLRGRDA
jgi:heme A synthase